MEAYRTITSCSGNLIFHFIHFSLPLPFDMLIQSAESDIRRYCIKRQYALSESASISHGVFTKTNTFYENEYNQKSGLHFIWECLLCAF